MVLCDAVDNFFGQIKLFEQFNSEFDVAALFVGNDLADVVEEAAEADNIGVGF